MSPFRDAIAAALLVALTACAPSSAQNPPISEQWRAVDVQATPIDIGAETIGALRFRGGLVLSSADYAFGGFSGIEVLDDGRLVAVTDNADWLEARLQLDESGALAGIIDARMALMRDENGEPFQSKAEGDAEGLAQLADGRLAVSFEQRQVIRIYDFNRDGPFGAAVRGPSLVETRDLPPNQGLEAITSAANGDLMVGAEGGSGRDTTLWRVSLDAQEPAAPVARLRLDLGYALTSLDRLPDNDFVALERFYAPIIGARARIIRFSEEALGAASADVRFDELALLAPPLPVDNFEGVAAVRMPDGATRLYIISDDNFSGRQRTLLYAFDLVE